MSAGPIDSHRAAPATFSSLGEFSSAWKLGSEFVGPKRVAMVCHTDQFFLTHRSMWAAALAAAGSDVTVIAPDTGAAETIRSLGFRQLHIPETAESSSPFHLLRAWVILMWRLVAARPDVVLLNSQLLYTLGTAYAVVNPRARVIRVVGGVGRALADSSRHSTASVVVRSAGRALAHLPNVFTLFQTEFDRSVFVQHKMLNSRRALVIPGSGIDVDAWPAWRPAKLDDRIVLFASRLTAEKGILEFLEAARLLEGSGWQFMVAGAPDSRVASTLTIEDVSRRADEAGVRLVGHQTDVAALLSRAALLVLPTRHPEGTPRILMEAAASATACVATSEPGCAAVVRDGVTGVLISRSPTAQDIAAAINELILSPDRLELMGRAARRHAKESFDLGVTITAFLEWAAVGAYRGPQTRPTI